MAASYELRVLEASIHLVTLKKYKRAFEFMDINGDGVHSLKDYEITREKFMTKANVSPEKRLQNAALFTDWWTKHMRADPEKPLGYLEWLKGVKRWHDEGGTTNAVTEIRTRFFTCTDNDDDGKIDRKEFKMFGECLGHSDLAYLDVAFNQIDKDKKGFVTLDEYVGAYLRYWKDPAVTLEQLPLYGYPSKTQGK